MEILKKTIFYNKKINIIGHRGVPELCKENTLESFQKAIDLNYDGIELDVMATKDQKVIIHHDLERAGTPILNINYFPMLKNYPLLKDVLLKIGHRTKINIEIKDQGKQSLFVLKTTIKILKELNLIENILISSFNPQIIRECKKIDDRFFTGWIWGRKNLYFFNLWNIAIKFYKPDAIHVHHSLVNNKMINKIHKKNLKILAYTVNNKKRLRELINQNIDGVFTDSPIILNLVRK